MMAIQNWIRCHWRNGRQVLHDVPETWHEEIEGHLRKHRGRTRDLGIVRTATLESVDIAWVECDVPLGSPEGDLTYRRARAVHALVRPRGDAGSWTRQEAESLLTGHYGEAVDKGLATQHRVLSRLSHPEDLDRAAGLFVGAEEPLPSALEQASESRDTARGLGYAQRHLIDAWEEWVAEARHGRGVSAPIAASVSNASLPGLAASVATQAPPVDPLAETRPHFVGAPSPVPPAEPAPEPEAAVELFDLSKPSRDRREAPSSSLSGLLGPSYTTTSGA